MVFFRKKRENESKVKSVLQVVGTTCEQEWAELPAYVEATPVEELKATVIAATIAAADATKSQFVVKKVLVKNPEITRVSVIAAAVAGSKHALRITRISERKNKVQN